MSPNSVRYFFFLFWQSPFIGPLVPCDISLLARVRSLFSGQATWMADGKANEEGMGSIVVYVGPRIGMNEIRTSDAAGPPSFSVVILVPCPVLEKA